MQHIVKRAGHNDLFDARKLANSVFAACFAHGLAEGESETIASRVAAAVAQQIAQQPTVASQELAALTYRQLAKYDPAAAGLYRSHRDIS